jgi:hypothetical protein
MTLAKHNYMVQAPRVGVMYIADYVAIGCLRLPGGIAASRRASSHDRAAKIGVARRSKLNTTAATINLSIFTALILQLAAIEAIWADGHKRNLGNEQFFDSNQRIINQRLFISFWGAEIGRYERRAYDCKDGWRVADHCISRHNDIERHFLLSAQCHSVRRFDA